MFGVFKNIYEFKPAHFGVWNKFGFHLEEYWKLESKLHLDNFKTTCDTIRFLLEDSISMQIAEEGSLCSMLSRWDRFKHHYWICK